MHSEANVNGHKPSLDVGRTECLESNESSSESLPISQRSQQWLRWYEGLENAEEVSVGDLPDEVQRRLKAVVRALRKLDEVANQG